MREAVKKITSALNTNGAVGETRFPPHELYEATVQKSFVLSSDQSHALHPNYTSKHEKNHQPQMNAGMVIKRNSNQRYATNGVTGVIIREIARRASLPPVQEFMVRQDCGCGSTIGPIISAATGIRAIDMGCPQLSMHSIRETMGVCDCKWWPVCRGGVVPADETCVFFPVCFRTAFGFGRPLLFIVAWFLGAYDPSFNTAMRFFAR
jgi:aspartyl aminopeptidase